MTQFFMAKNTKMCNWKFIGYQQHTKIIPNPDISEIKLTRRIFGRANLNCSRTIIITVAKLEFIGFLSWKIALLCVLIVSIDLISLAASFHKYLWGNFSEPINPLTGLRTVVKTLRTVEKELKIIRRIITKECCDTKVQNKNNQNITSKE